MRMISTNLNNLREQYPQSFLVEYISKCKSGEILIGRELMQWLDILLEHFSDGNIRIDFEAAHKRIKFIETRCRHFEAPFAGKPFILELFQKAFIESIYIFYIYDNEINKWVRKFQEVLFLVARKNGKTPLVAAICLAEFYCGSKGIKILCSSNDYEQASLLFDAINNMREESPALEKVTRKTVKGIFFGNPRTPKKKGKFSYSNKGSIRKISAKTGAKEGRNLGMAAADEVHELPDNTSIMPIRQALSTQEEPLFIELTTEGFLEDGYLSARLVEARQVLSGELDRPRWNIWLYTQDSEAEVWQDERTWVKSNPGLGTIKKWSFIRQMVDEARTNTATRLFVLSKDFNLRQSQAAAWLLPEEYSYPAKFKIEDLRGTIALGGGDLSETTDLACAGALIMRPGNNTKYFIAHYFIPESKVEKGLEEDKKNYLDWAKRGLLTISPGNENDYSLITQWFVDLYKKYGIRPYRIGLDRWGANYLKNDLDRYYDAEKILFNKYNISNPMKLAEADFRSHSINYNEHEITRWCLGNTGVVVDNLGLVMPVKMQPTKRIDGTAVLLLCYYMYNTYRTEYLQLIK